MHVLFVHQNYPAQFGHVARHLVTHGYQCTFVSEREPGDDQGVHRLQYRLRGGATAQNHYCSRSFENYIWHSHGVYEALRNRRDLQPDLVVGHSGFGSTLFLRELFAVPIVNYFEYFYHPHHSDMDFRPEFPAAELDVLRSYARNAMLLLDLQYCAAGYSPTAWQRSLFPAEYQPKLETIFDGIDTQLWRPRPPVEAEPLVLNQCPVPADVPVITYVSRGFESMRGFDIFLRIAKRIYTQRRDVLFVVVGSDRVCYGGDLKHIQAKTFREHALAQDQYDLDRFLFTGLLPSETLAQLLARSDLHLYLTVPFVLSWSLMNALACGALVLASHTPPVAEMIRHGENGLLADFFDVDRFAQLALEALAVPDRFAPLRRAARECILRQYSLEQVLPRLTAFFDRVVHGAAPRA